MPKGTSLETTKENKLASPKLRVVVFGGGIGFFVPLMERFKRDFEVVAVLSPEIPSYMRKLLLLASFRFSKTSWYRRWTHLQEKTPHAFRMRTKAAAKSLQSLQGQYDFILHFGAMSALGIRQTVPLFLITDSCRLLSSRNSHDEVSHFPNEQEKAEWIALEGDFYRSAMRIFVGSSFVERALVDEYRVASQRVVVSGFGAGPKANEPYEKRFDGKTLLYIGKGDFEKKGGIVLLDAFQLLRKRIPQATLHIVGQDDLPVIDGVVNHGFVRDRTVIRDLMRAAHLFVLPSLVDRNPITILEAMASATPCICSDYGAMPELVGDAGVVVASGDVNGLAAAMSTVLEDPVLSEQLGANGRRRYAQKYDWDVVWKLMRSQIDQGLTEFRASSVA